MIIDCRTHTQYKAYFIACRMLINSYSVVRFHVFCSFEIWQCDKDLWSSNRFKIKIIIVISFCVVLCVCLCVCRFLKWLYVMKSDNRQAMPIAVVNLSKVKIGIWKNFKLDRWYWINTIDVEKKRKKHSAHHSTMCTNIKFKKEVVFISWRTPVSHSNSRGCNAIFNRFVFLLYIFVQPKMILPFWLIAMYVCAHGDHNDHDDKKIEKKWRKPNECYRKLKLMKLLASSTTSNGSFFYLSTCGSFPVELMHNRNYKTKRYLNVCVEQCCDWHWMCALMWRRWCILLAYRPVNFNPLKTLFMINDHWAHVGQHSQVLWFIYQSVFEAIFV